MSRRPGRTPNAAERALWDKVVQNATPLGDPKPALKGQAPKPGAMPIQPSPELPRSSTRIPDDFMLGRKSDKGGAGTPGSDAKRPDPYRAPDLRMDHKTHGRMVRGKMTPEGRIDLHGMTLAVAQPVLTRFLLSAHGDGKRLVLVITGKGRDRDGGGPIPNRVGALRHEVPLWLRQGALKSIVLDYTPAHPKHGGSGAYYVYLRRRR